MSKQNVNQTMVEKDLQKNALNNQINYEKDIYGNNKDKRNNSFRK